MEFSTQLYVPQLGCTVAQVTDALENVMVTLAMRGHIGAHVKIHYVGIWDGHYEFLFKGAQYDVMRLRDDWQAMDEQRIG